MRCKPGDLAVVVRSEAGNEGRLVNVVRLAKADEVCPEMPMPQWVVEPVGGPLKFRIGDGPIYIGSPGDLDIFSDSWLMPIGNPDGADETLLWAGLPKSTWTLDREKVDA